MAKRPREQEEKGASAKRAKTEATIQLPPVAELCSAIRSFYETPCELDVDAETLSQYIQEAYGRDILYSILAHRYGVCHAHSVVLKYVQSRRECAFRGAFELGPCAPDVVWQLVDISTSIDHGGHMSIMLVNTQAREAEYYEPNGRTAWTEPCGTVLEWWLSTKFPGFRFLDASRSCPRGLQKIEGGGTCWLWSLLYFVLRIDCPLDRDVLLEALSAMSSSELHDLIRHFGCYILQLGQRLRLDLASELYWTMHKALDAEWAARSDDPELAQQVQRAQKRADHLYSTGRVRDLAFFYLLGDVTAELLERHPRFLHLVSELIQSD